MDPATPARTVACPTCRGPSRFAPDNPYRPFCSERCRNLDLGAWASEKFRVDAEGDESADDSGPPAAPPRH